MFAILIVLVTLLSVQAADFPSPDNPSSCGFNITLSRDFPVFMLQSPGFGLDSYTNNIDCTWNVFSMEHHYVYVTVQDISLKGSVSPHCSDSDKIVLKSPTGLTLGKFCMARHKAAPISMLNFSVAFKAEGHVGDPLINHGFALVLTAKPIYHLTCNKIGFELAMPKRVLALESLVPYSSYHLLDDTCRAVVEKGQLVLRSIYDSCRTSHTPGVGYFNSILMTVPGSCKSVTRMVVHCRHPGRTFIVSSNYTPSHADDDDEEVRQLMVDVDTSNLPSYSKLTNTLVATVEGSEGSGVRLHIKEKDDYIRFEVVNHVCPAKEEIAAKSCWITTSPHSTDTKRFTFLNNGCPHPDNPVIRHESFHCSDHFSIKARTLKSNPLGVYYVHCEVNLCSIADAQEASKCDKACKPPTAATTTSTAASVVAGTGRIVGVVRDAVRRDELAAVNVIAKSGEAEVARTTTSPNGTHFMSLQTGATYTVVFESTGYHTATMNNVKTTADQDTFVETILYIEEKFVGPGTASGQIKNALSGRAEPEIKLEIRAGLNTVEGLVLRTLTTDEKGYWSTELETGYYTAQLSKLGFTTSTLSVTVLGGQTKSEQNGAIAPTPAEGETRIVLTWGEQPLDVDAHLTGPTDDGGRFHVFWHKLGNKTASPWSNLDVDDRDGDGPETVTIDQQLQGLYRYSVHDYSTRNATQSFELAKSPAKVTVYRGNQIPEIYYVPQTEGTLWTVFEVVGGHVRVVNRMSYQNHTGLIE